MAEPTGPRQRVISIFITARQPFPDKAVIHRRVFVLAGTATRLFRGESPVIFDYARERLRYPLYQQERLASDHGGAGVLHY